jgi:uncharacterized protein
MIQSSILWRRLDAPGHDACRLIQRADGWRLAGTAVYLHEGAPARLDYRLDCDEAWHTTSGEVRGWIGERALEFAITHTDHWRCNGVAVSGVDGCVDLDLGFTPATNLAQLRRLALADGQGADVPVAWLDVGTGAIELLQQHYQRRSGPSYWYEARRFGYAELLEVDLAGFVRDYPHLWQAVD